MTVENQNIENDMSSDRFPVGMRVLAVDDDPICLKVLESLLRKCQYQVTTANQAIKALKMLRENRNMVDLVISDVNMPDMDGFKLLEHVGLEMDLPVIMLSSHSDTKLVMKGITHGACDYLLKPVRIEELKNIWQHVVRRKKSEPKNQGGSVGQENKASMETSEGANGTGSTGNFDQNSKLNRKRKESQDEDEDEESDDEGREDEDPGTQKKPRIVWSTDLHRKFVDAVQQLGYEKAFPKKILDMMNVEGLTRENVASHLQKYRQFLKRLHAAEMQKPNNALRVKDFPYPGTGYLSYNDLGDLRSLTNHHNLRLTNSTISPSISHPGLFGRLNSPGSLTMRGIASPTEINPARKFQPQSLLGNNNNNHQSPAPLFQGFQSSLELNQFQVPQTGFGFQGPKSTLGGSNDASNSLILGIQSSVRPASSSLQSSGDYFDHNRCNEPWQSAVQSSSTFGLNSLPNNIIPSTTSQFGNNPRGFSSTIPLSSTSSLADPRDLQQGRGDGFIGNIVPTNNFVPRQTWEGGFNNSLNLGQRFTAFDSLIKDSTVPIFEQLNGSSSSVFLSNEIDKSASEMIAMKPIEDNNNNLLPNNYESLDDILSSLMKREQNEPALMNGDFGFDNYPLGSCM